jgi:leishmanolysin
MVINSTRITVLNAFLPKLQLRLQDVLSVQRVQSSLSLAGLPTCGAKGGAPIVTTSYTNTDLVVFVTSRPSPSNAADAGAVAWAITCAADQRGRSIAGQVNINPSLFFDKAANTQLYTVMHEITHVLGFSSTQFPTFIDQYGQPRNNVIKQVQRTVNGVTQTVNYLATPSVVAAAQAHFNCPTAIGAELEEYGGAGTTGSHLEMRTFLGEMMIGAIYYSNPVNTPAFSVFTLAALHDSGWYKADFSKAEKLDYGYQAGCSFIGDNSCENWKYDTGNYTSGYFCNTPNQIDCSFNHIYLGYCSASTYTSALPGYYQHFPSSPTMGGTNPYMDYCPIVQGYSNGDCRDGTGMDMQYAQYAGNTFGRSNSRCFISNLLTPSSPYNSKDRDCRCYLQYCISGTLVITVGSANYTCPKSGGVLTNIAGYSGYLNCPDSRVLCPNTNDTIAALFDPVPLSNTVTIKPSGNFASSRYQMGIGFFFFVLLVTIFLL